jgi:hypothetical protein
MGLSPSLATCDRFWGGQMPTRKRGKRHAPGRRGRNVAVREPRQRFLIVCEGGKTEPNYFRTFGVQKQVVEVVGTGSNTVGVVEEAIRRKEAGLYDQVWCVFDRDDFPADHFNRALRLADQYHIQVAYSNEAFELWYVLHFHYYRTACLRQDYIGRLSRDLGYDYCKNSTTMYDALLSRQPQAIQYAERLLAQYEPPNPAEDNPSTTVHLLVQELNRFLRGQRV